MSRTRIKICGITDTDAARAAVDAGADAIGLMFADGSPREVTLEQARAIIAALPAMVEPVGVFMDQPMDYVGLTAQALGLRTVQLHGGEEAERVGKLAPLRVIKAVSFDSEHVESALDMWRNVANVSALMLDAPPPNGQTMKGGHGAAFDWDALAALQQRGSLSGLPAIVLAGGLNAQYVGEAVTKLRPYAVDVSSGVESQRGVKDAKTIAAFCDAVRAADSK